MKKNRKAKKWQLYAAIGAASVVVLGAGGILLFRQPSQTAVKDEPTHLVVAKEGSVASSCFYYRDSNGKKLNNMVLFLMY